MKTIYKLIGGTILAVALLTGCSDKPKEPTAEELQENAIAVETIAERTEEADLTAVVVHEVTDEEVQNAIHLMSHQKVKADTKWGAILLTQERVETLSKQIDDNKDSLKHYDTYRKILDKWVVGDFSEADKDHNAVWRLQNGNIGKANGLLTPQEELEFVEEHLR